MAHRMLASQRAGRLTRSWLSEVRCVLISLKEASPLVHKTSSDREE